MHPLISSDGVFLDRTNMINRINAGFADLNLHGGAAGMLLSC